MAVIQNEKFTLGIVNNDGSPKIGSLVELKSGSFNYPMTELGSGKYRVNSIPTGKYTVFVDSVSTQETVPVGSGQVAGLGNELDAILVGTADNWTLNTPEELKQLLNLDQVTNFALPDPTGENGKVLGVQNNQFQLQSIDVDPTRFGETWGVQTWTGYSPYTGQAQFTCGAGSAFKDNGDLVSWTQTVLSPVWRTGTIYTSVIYIDTVDGIVKSTSQFLSQASRRTNFILCTLTSSDLGSTITGVICNTMIADQPLGFWNALLEVAGQPKAGLKLGGNSDLTFQLSGGSVFYPSTNYLSNSDDPHIFPVSSIAVASWFVADRNGFESADEYTDLDDSTNLVRSVQKGFDDNGTNAEIQDSNFGNHRIFAIVENDDFGAPAGINIVIQRSQYEYNNLDSALESIKTENFVLNDLTSRLIPLGVLTLRGNANFTDNESQSRFTNAGTWGDLGSAGGVSQASDLKNIFSVETLAEFKQAISSTTPSVVVVTQELISTQVETFDFGASHIIFGKRIVLQTASTFNGASTQIDFYNSWVCSNPPQDCSISGSAFLRFTNLTITEGLFSYLGTGALVFENSGGASISGATQAFWKNTNKTNLPEIIQVSDLTSFENALQLQKDVKMIFITNEIDITGVSPYDIQNIWGKNEVFGPEITVIKGASTDTIKFSRESTQFGQYVNFYSSNFVFFGISTFETDGVDLKCRNLKISNGAGGNLTVSSTGIDPALLVYEEKDQGTISGDSEQFFWDNSNQTQGGVGNSVSYVSTEDELDSALSNSEVRNIFLTENIDLTFASYSVNLDSGESNEYKTILFSGDNKITALANSNFSFSNCRGLKILADFRAGANVTWTFAQRSFLRNVESGGSFTLTLSNPTYSTSFEKVVTDFLSPFVTGTISGTAIQSFWDNTNNTFEREVVSVATTSVLNIDSDLIAQSNVTALASSLTISNPTGGTDGKKLIIRIKDNGTTRALNWGAGFKVIGNTLPIATNPNKTIYLGTIYNQNSSSWDVVSIVEES